MRDFLKEFKAKIAAIDTDGIKVISEPVKKSAMLEDQTIRRFNIHKRSLPPGSPPLDKIVFFNVSKTVATWLAEKIVKARMYHNEPQDTNTLIYYDVVPADATPRERSIYHNSGPITTEDVPGFDTRWIG